MSVMENIGNGREVCRQARENSNRLVAVRDINSLWRRSWLMEDRNNFFRRKDIMRGQGTLGLLKWEELMRSALKLSPLRPHSYSCFRLLNGGFPLLSGRPLMLIFRLPVISSSL